MWPCIQRWQRPIYIVTLESFVYCTFLFYYTVYLYLWFLCKTCDFTCDFLAHQKQWRNSKKYTLFQSKKKPMLYSIFLIRLRFLGSHCKSDIDFFALKITFGPFLNLFLLQVIRTRSECVECRTPYPAQPMRHRYMEKVAEELADLITKKNKIIDCKPSWSQLNSLFFSLMAVIISDQERKEPTFFLLSDLRFYYVSTVI